MNKYSYVDANVDIVTPRDIVTPGGYRHPRRMSSPRENIVTPQDIVTPRESGGPFKLWISRTMWHANVDIVTPAKAGAHLVAALTHFGKYR